MFNVDLELEGIKSDKYSKMFWELFIYYKVKEFVNVTKLDVLHTNERILIKLYYSDRLSAITYDGDKPSIVIGINDDRLPTTFGLSEFAITLSHELWHALWLLVSKQNLIEDSKSRKYNLFLHRVDPTDRRADMPIKDILNIIKISRPIFWRFRWTFRIRSLDYKKIYKTAKQYIK